MQRHLTVRMAWHDHGWDGTICRNPSANSYCTGAHSLLSERITTDDLAGLRQERIDAVVHNLLSGKLAGSAEVGFSRHHYRL